MRPKDLLHLHFPPSIHLINLLILLLNHFLSNSPESLLMYLTLTMILRHTQLTNVGTSRIIIWYLSKEYCGTISIIILTESELFQLIPLKDTFILFILWTMKLYALLFNSPELCTPSHMQYDFLKTYCTFTCEAFSSETRCSKLPFIKTDDRHRSSLNIYPIDFKSYRNSRLNFDPPEVC